MSDEAARLAALETRVGAAEQIISAIRMRSDDHENDIRAFGPLVTDNVRIQERVDAHAGLIAELRTSLAALREGIATRIASDEKRDEENKRFRVTTYISLATVFIAFCGVLVAVLTALGGHA